jgi:hypothetical protein
MKNKDIKFGVENMSICNLESLCLLDMKIFLYSCLFQTISFIKSKQLNKFDFMIQPYWLQENLCSAEQSDWWFFCSNFLFRPAQVKQNSNSLSFFGDSLTFNLTLDIKKQNELSKVLELIRLKINLVELKEQNLRFKLNLKILINLTNYLQYLYNNEKSIFAANNLQQAESEFTIYSPKQKLNSLKQYLIKYWKYLTQYLVKMKLIVSQNSVNTIQEESFGGGGGFEQDKLNLDFIDLSNLNDSFCLPNQTNLFLNQKQKIMSLYDFYFKNYTSVDSFFEETNRLMSNVKIDTRRLSCLVNQQKNECMDHYDTTIKNGLLNLAIINLSEMSSDGCDGSSDEKNSNDDKLRDSIALFDQMEKSLNEKTKHELNPAQLKLCKAMGDILIKHRGTVQESSNQWDKMSILIGYLKRNIRTVLKKRPNDHELKSLNESLNQTTTVYDALDADTSISEQLEHVSEIIRENDMTPEERKALEEKRERERREKEEEELRKQKEEEERLRLEREREEERLRIEREKEEERIRLEREREEERKLREEQERLERKERERKEREEREARQRELESQRKRQEEEEKRKQDEINEKHNKRIQGLIEILTKQKIKHFELNIDTLKEQYDFIRSQFKQMKNEIDYLAERNQRRQVRMNK